jgi:hypothetical protein
MPHCGAPDSVPCCFRAPKFPDYCKCRGGGILTERRLDGGATSTVAPTSRPRAAALARNPGRTGHQPGPGVSVNTCAILVMTPTLPSAGLASRLPGSRQVLG